ncbi:MAG: hypothetical protein V1738_02895 [Patescibacteria group bacterium]
MRNRTVIYLLLPLLLLGAGCADEAVNDAAKPIEVPLAALGDAKALSLDVQARQLRSADSVANLLPVAMVLTDGQAEPTNEVERLATKTFGCEDRIGYVRVSREAGTGDLVNDALTTLFAEREYSYAGTMHNSLPDSSLKVDEVRYTDEHAQVFLSGEIVSPGACADPRIKEQVEATVRQYYPDYEIILNGTEANWRCFGDLSGLCE